MADYDERSQEDLTEDPSAHKLEEMRSKGQVAQSKEVTSTLILLFCSAFIYSWTKNFGEEFKVMFQRMVKITFIERIEITDSVKAAGIFQELVPFVLSNLLPLLLVAAVVAIVSSIAQTQGLLFSSDAIKFDLERLNPVSGFKKIFSVQGLMEGVKSVIKFTLVAYITYSVSRSSIEVFPHLSDLEIPQIMVVIGELIFKLVFSIGGVMIVISGLDYGWQWWTMRKKAMMTKVEAKQENKEREGDPQIKARMRSVQREMARKRMMKAIPKADVIIVNPTHIAVALVYEKELLAPKVVAKGGDFMAERIKEIAKLHNVPIVENKPLARALFKSVKIGQVVPRNLYQAVAEVLAYVYRLKPKDIFSN